MLSYLLMVQLNYNVFVFVCILNTVRLIWNNIQLNMHKLIYSSLHTFKHTDTHTHTYI